MMRRIPKKDWASAVQWKYEAMLRYLRMIDRRLAALHHEKAVLKAQVRKYNMQIAELEEQGDEC